MSGKRSLYFDCTTGVSGDMILGSLLDLGINIEQLSEELSKLKLGEFDFMVNKEEKYGVRGVNVTIHQKNSHHHHEHCHRSYREIEKIILDGKFSKGIESRAISIYKAIAEAEASVHQTDLEHVHFHEVGRNVAILNIVGTAICLEWLEVEEITCSELHDGTGFIECSHGLIPVPVPAVLELLKNTGYKLIQEVENQEMVTPSGLGILKGLHTVYTGEIPTPPTKIGYGFGKKELGRLSVVTGYLLDKSCKSYKIF